MIYLGRPVFEFEVDWTNPVNQRLTFEPRQVALGFGAPVRAGVQPAVVHGWRFTLQLLGSEQIRAVDDFCAGLRGPGNGFWLPTPLEAMRMVAADPAGLWLEIAAQGLAETEWAAAELHLYFHRPGQATGAAKVGAVTDTGQGTERVTLETPLGPGLLAPDTIVRRLSYARLAEAVERATWEAEGWQTRAFRVVELPWEDCAAEGWQPIYLYHLWMDPPAGRHWRYTSGAGSVTSAGQSYESAAITHGPWRQTLRADADALQIEAAVTPDQRATHPLASCFPAAPSQPVQVEVRQTTWTAPDATQLVFRGQVRAVREEEGRLLGECAGLLSLLDGSLPRWPIHPECNHVLYQPETCGVNRARFETRACLVSLSDGVFPPVVRVEWLDPGSVPQTRDYFAHGWVEAGAGATYEARPILSSQPVAGREEVDLELNAPLRYAQVGQPLQVIPGCDGAWATCRGKFDNSTHFGGFPFAPPGPPSLAGAGGIAADQTAPAEPAVLPYLAGRRRLGVIALSNLLETRVTSSAPGAEPRYRVTFAGGLCHGRLSAVDAIYADGQALWVGPLFFTGADYLDLPLTAADTGEVGRCRVYAGTDSQAPDPALRENDGQFHPAYRGVAYAVFRSLLLGPNMVRLPRLELIVRRASEATLLPAAGADSTSGCLVNPVWLLADWLANPRLGLGLDPGWLDTESLEQTGALLQSEQALLAPLLDQPAEFHSLLRHCCDCLEAYPVVTVAGRFSLGLCRPPGAPEDLPEVTESLLTRAPCFEVGAESQVLNEVRVLFPNAAQDFRTDLALWRDRGGGGLQPSWRVQTVARPWIVTPGLAENTALATGRAAALPEWTGHLHLCRLENWFEALAPGQCFRLADPARGLHGLVCRVTERTDPGPARMEFEIRFRVERTYLTPGPGRAKGSAKSMNPLPQPALLPAAPPAFPQVEFFELPLALCPHGTPALAALAPRHTPTASSARLWLARSAAEEEATAGWIRLGEMAPLPQGGWLVAEYPPGLSADLDGGPIVQLTGAPRTVEGCTLLEALRDPCLLFLDEEILSVTGALTLGAGRYRLPCLRGRFGTPVQPHGVGTAASLVARSSLSAFSDPSFRVGNVVRLKLAPLAGSAMAPLDQVPLQSHAVSGHAYTGLVATNLRVNGRSRNAFYSPAAGLRVDSDAPPELAGLPTDVTLAGRLLFSDRSGSTLAELSVAPVLRGLRFDSVQLEDLLGSVADFRVGLSLRFTHALWSLSSAPVEIEVWRAPS